MENGRGNGDIFTISSYFSGILPKISIYLIFPNSAVVENLLIPSNYKVIESKVL